MTMTFKSTPEARAYLLNAGFAFWRHGPRIDGCSMTSEWYRCGEATATLQKRWGSIKIRFSASPRPAGETLH